MGVPRETVFEAEEHGRRLAAVQGAMAEAGIGLLVTCGPSNICYLDGYDSVNLLDLMFLAVPAEGPPIHYIWQFERGRFESSAVGAELVCWDTGVEPIGFVAADLERRGLKRGRIAVDTGSTYTPYDVVRRLMDGLGAEPVKGLIERIRLVKSPAELAQVRKAAAITDAGAKAALDAVGEGASDH
ncbi:MAG: aminopeptidase P family N-terminal domain-containing protein, partial [Thiotrichales bacterium]|nr:aminopeptidase P family N-terminal domain-containing protein [Thiotrichales bacterium]